MLRALLIVVALHAASALAGQAGQLDAGFGVGGRIMTDLPAAGGAVRMVRQPDGKLLFAGRLHVGTTDDMMLARYLPDGTLDPGFGTAGFVTTHVAGGDDGVTALVLDPDGTIVVGGVAAIVRYLPDGALDPTFGTSGVALVSFPPGSVGVRAIARQPDGHLVVSLGSVIVRFRPDGTQEGAAITPPFNTDALTVQPDGAFIGGRFNFALARYLADGTLDASFGTGGVVAPLAIGSIGISDLDVAPDGTIVAVGETIDQGVVRRVNPDGTPNVGFGGGLILLDDVRPFAFTFAPDGKLLVAGAALSGVGLARLLSDGTHDPTFGQGGLVETAFVGGRHNSAWADGVGIEPDGRIVAGGTIAFHRDLLLARYFGGTCGDGVIDAGEDCDDGNLVVVARLNGTNYDLDGDETLALKADVIVAVPINPLLHGLRLLVDDQAGSRFDVTLPPGALAGTPGSGWTVRTHTTTKWTYVDRTLFPLVGIIRAVVEDRSAVAAGLVRVIVKGHHGNYARFADALPLTATVVFDAGGGPCGLLAFPGVPGPACAPTPSGTRLVCN